MAPEPIDIFDFAATQISLLDAELAAERDDAQQLLSQSSPTAIARAGLGVLNLRVSAQRTGLGGKTVIELELDPAAKSGAGELPQHNVRTGDLVAVADQPRGSERKSEKAELKKNSVIGVVVKVQGRAIAVALEKEDEDAQRLEGKRLWLVKLVNDITYKRITHAMTRLKELKEAEYSSLVRVLFGRDPPSALPQSVEDLGTGPGNLEWIDPSLNESQKKAVKFAMASREVALIHGPPGTGKTRTLIELILQMLKQDLRLLVCGPSNVSVDNLVERLAPHKVPIVRLGHPARLLPSVQDYSLDVLTRNSEAAGIVRDIQEEIRTKEASIRKTKSGAERRSIYVELKGLRKEYRARERKCVDSLIHGSKVVLATLHGGGGWNVKNEQFDVVIIDEASQALEAQCWIPLLKAKKVVLAGDHMQLPPTVKSATGKVQVKARPEAETNAASGAVGGISLETTLFDRLLKLHGAEIKRMLTIQYRMHEKIMAFPSKEMYHGKLEAAEFVRTRLLRDLPYDVADTEDSCEPLVFWDTQGGDFPEKTEDDEVGGGKSRIVQAESKSNEGEAQVVKLHVAALVDKAGVKAEDIAVITPYNAQLALLSRMLKEQYPGLELGSVDGFQGREKEAVIVSLVRSGAEVGFLAEKRRLNVSMTRPKRHLCVVGDSATLCRGSSFLKRWMDHLEEHADLRYPDLSNVQRQSASR